MKKASALRREKGEEALAGTPKVRPKAFSTKVKSVRLMGTSPVSAQEVTTIDRSKSNLSI